MINFKCEINNIQHINNMIFEVDLSKNQLICIVGKNGCGKTTLIRGINTLISSDTFTKTASPYIFKDASNLNFQIDSKTYNFNYDKKLKTIDTKDIIDQETKDNIFVELPIPYGVRFNYERLQSIDVELRQKISTRDFKDARGLKSFFNKIYNSNKFDDLKSVEIKNNKYYFILKKDGYYIREDYLSSGEYFLISLYKIIQKQCKFIVIDEIDISLDTSTQVRLVKELENFCQKYEVNIIFTTHSLALMKSANSLRYMDIDNNNKTTIAKKSYNYIKSLLFEFKGWDKYILVEDEMSYDYIKHLLKDTNCFYKYKIIYIGGHSNVIDLMKRNEKEEFFSVSDNVISILDGDQRNTEKYQNNTKILFTPFKEDVEKDLFKSFTINNSGFFDSMDFQNIPINGKGLYNAIKEKEFKTNEQIFNFLNNENSTLVSKFTEELKLFLDN